MATMDLTAPEYWQSDEVDIRLNPKTAHRVDLKGLDIAIRSQGIEAAVVIATSGTQGSPQFVVLSKAALLHSAAAVNQWCSVSDRDIWLGGLSTFHVGGLGIYARAFLAQSQLIAMPWDQWTRDGRRFLESIGEATLTSLTPVHLHDLVAQKVRAPGSLRGVYIGGGVLSTELVSQALDLGWPVWPTYGMSETCSQVATSLTGEIDRLPVLPHWDCQLAGDGSGQLLLRGKALFSGYFSIDQQGAWHWQQPFDQDGFYQTSDAVALDGRCLTVVGRCDEQVKILGELVSVAKLRGALQQRFPEDLVDVLTVADARRGYRLLGVIEGLVDQDSSFSFEQWNRTSFAPFERLSELRWIESFPLTELGKLDRRALMQLVLHDAKS